MGDSAGPIAGATMSSRVVVVDVFRFPQNVQCSTLVTTGILFEYGNSHIIITFSSYRRVFLHEGDKQATAVLCSCCVAALARHSVPVSGAPLSPSPANESQK